MIGSSYGNRQFVALLLNDDKDNLTRGSLQELEQVYRRTVQPAIN
jgi:hypothetical protein